MTIHVHPNDQKWIHACGVSGHGERVYNWLCVVEGQEPDNYLCNEHGWIEMQYPPKRDGTLCYVVEADAREQHEDIWCADELDWEYSVKGLVSHWMPQMELPL